ncbi:MAG: VWA domain-containing protein, partial [Candidatus Dormibacteria bacterium]
AAIKEGSKRFEPGVLAEANRNILYVDEVNLLDDHLVDVLLDAAAMGVNVVEREGISVDHPSRFILVGTMNPEEGELRPQLLDRFGLCVDVVGLTSLAARVRVLEQEHRREHDASGLAAGSAADEQRLRAGIAQARDLLPLVETTPSMRRLASLLSVDAGALGHRADIVVSRTARALCAWREAQVAVAHAAGETERRRPADALRVTADDVIQAAELALTHRRTERSGDGSGAAAESIADQARRRAEEVESVAANPDPPALTEEAESSPEPTEGEGSDAGGEAVSSQAPAGAASERGSAQQLFEGDLFGIKRLQLPRDRRVRRTQGKRSQSRSGDKRGRYVRATQTEHTTDLAFDATLRAAAPHQPRRRAAASAAGAPRLRLERQDLRQKVRQRRTGTLIVFVVDASASMDAEQRMRATKGAVLSLLRDAYVRRDKVALIVFNGRTARTVLRPTSSVDLAENRLQRLTVGGTTPLTHGLVAGLKVVRTERLRDPSVYPLMVLISDGRGNISLFGEEPLVEAQSVAAQIRAEGVRSLVIDSARDYTETLASLPRVGGMRQPLFGATYALNACQDLADHLGGTYFGLYDLSQGSILRTVQQSLRSRSG